MKYLLSAFQVKGLWRGQRTVWQQSHAAANLVSNVLPSTVSTVKESPPAALGMDSQWTQVRHTSLQRTSVKWNESLLNIPLSNLMKFQGRLTGGRGVLNVRKALSLLTPTKKSANHGLSECLVFWRTHTSRLNILKGKAVQSLSPASPPARWYE